MTRDEADSFYGGSSFRGINKAVADLYSVDGIFPPLMGSLDEKMAKEVPRSVKAEKRLKQEEERKRNDEERAKANAAHAQRFSDAGMAASAP